MRRCGRARSVRFHLDRRSSPVRVGRTSRDAASGRAGHSSRRWPRRPTRVEIGTLVMCTAFRNPALLAKMADALDEVSAGRLILGLGAGWHEPEFRAFGYPFDHLASRFEDALRIIAPLVRSGAVDYQGTYERAVDCVSLPRGPRPSGSADSDWRLAATDAAADGGAGRCLEHVLARPGRRAAASGWRRCMPPAPMLAAIRRRSSSRSARS